MLGVLPLLIGVTLASAQPALFVGFLLVSAVLFGKQPSGANEPRRDENTRRKIIREADVDADGDSGDCASNKTEAGSKCVEPGPGPTPARRLPLIQLYPLLTKWQRA